MTRFGTFAAAALAALAIACSKGNTIDDAQEYCGALVGAGADVLVSCFGNETREAAVYEVAFAYGFDCGDLTADTVGYDSARGEACLAALRGWDCSQYWWTGQPPPDCFAAFVGQVPDGGGCTSSWSCQSGLCQLSACNAPGVCLPTAADGEPCGVDPDYLGCRPGSSCSANVCVANPLPPPVVGDGASCGPDAPCADPFWCDGSLEQPVCKPIVADGGTCTTNAQCAWGAYCDGTCVRTPAVGDACEPGAGECVWGAFCTEAGVCAGFPHAGGSCAATPSGELPYCLASWCEYASSTCKAFLRIGDACDATAGDFPCGYYGWCAAGVCEPNYCGPLD
jgi:hypothetical protein